MLLHTTLLLLAAVGGSLHCLGMCGGFITGVNALAQGTSSRSRLLGHVLYHGGRLTSYMFLGALAGAGGHFLTAPGPFLHTLIDLSAGAFVLAVGLRLAGFLPVRRLIQLEGIVGFPQPLATLLRLRRLSSALYLGLFNGFIPCPLIAAFLAQAAATGSPAGGALIMAALVIGSAPGMLLLGCLVLSHAARGKAVRVSGALLSVLGIMTLLHAVGVTPSLFGAH